MQEQQKQKGTTTPVEPLEVRVQAWAKKMWQPAGTVAAVLLALLLGWSVVNGKHGLSAWQKQRTEHKQLDKEIEELKQENSKLKDHIDRLKNDPDAIAHEAREQLHYAKPGEVIVALPTDPKSDGQGGAK
ncbi:MAG: septum formation initiator family protein [Acidobacteriota bacterium]|nr:septum formation initiator family protein [Acidobacteriota bacterium]